MFLKSGWSCWNFLYEWLKLCQFATPTESSTAKSEELRKFYWNSLHLEQWLITGQFNRNILYDCLTQMNNNNLAPIVLYECDIPISHLLLSVHHLWPSLFWRTPQCQSTENNLVWRMSVSITSERLLFLRQSLFPSSEVTTVLETMPIHHWKMITILETVYLSIINKWPLSEMTQMVSKELYSLLNPPDQAPNTIQLWTTLFSK